MKLKFFFAILFIFNNLPLFAQQDIDHPSGQSPAFEKQGQIVTFQIFPAKKSVQVKIVGIKKAEFSAEGLQLFAEFQSNDQLQNLPFKLSQETFQLDNLPREVPIKLKLIKNKKTIDSIEMNVP